jgi:hypothetical protein
MNGMTHRLRGLAGIGLIATLAAMVTTTLAFLAEADTATTTALLGLHLVAATVMIPTLARSLRTRTD